MRLWTEMSINSNISTTSARGFIRGSKHRETDESRRLLRPSAFIVLGVSNP